jgi:hypothetical protein
MADDRAIGVVIHRMRPRGTIISPGVDASANLQLAVAAVFPLDLYEPALYFYATRVVVHQEDVLFASDALQTVLLKFLNVVVVRSTIQGPKFDTLCVALTIEAVIRTMIADPRKAGEVGLTSSGEEPSGQCCSARDGR